MYYCTINQYQYCCLDNTEYKNDFLDFHYFTILYIKKISIERTGIELNELDRFVVSLIFYC